MRWGTPELLVEKFSVRVWRSKALSWQLPVRSVLRRQWESMWCVLAWSGSCT